MSVSIPAQAIRDAQGADSELWPVLLAIAGPESGWNPGAVGDGGASFGYLQFYTRGGLGDGHDPAELLDGPSNMRLGAQYIRGRLAAGATLWDALQPWSARPQAWALLQRIQTEGVEGVADVPRVASDGGSSGGGLLALAGVALAIYLLWD